ncbi:hypothetical protein RDWZM_010123 [Blomia tropicalis]|uniref:Uncharacterized protein n=1 Tax=Blomia tropicalis TaxID=40697 RepID=A0A9Q0LYU1_BLOTA|nr:hypothetical protein RDWZM_010123 [Blomia tropicalis]
MLRLIILFIYTVLSVSTNPTDRCIDFELDRIDAITTMTNGSMLLISRGNFWLLHENQVPSMEYARSISSLVSVSDQPITKLVDPDSLAATNIGVDVQDGVCKPTRQRLLLYSWTSPNRSMISIFQDDVLLNKPNITELELFRSAKSIDWSQPIDGMAYWQNLTIIFQNGSFISVRCVNGHWKQVVHKAIGDVFPGLPIDQTLDSVFIRQSQDQMDAATVYMFYGNQFYECSVTGNDACEGPYNLMSEFFNVNHFCADSQLGRAESTRRMIIALLIVLIILISSCIIGSILYFCFKPEHFTYLVNGKIRSNYNRDHLSYESLKRNENPPTQQQSNSVECKSVTNGKS